MPRSMTGFGAGRAETTGGSASIEIRTVNHRHLDVRWHGFSDHPELVLEAERVLKSSLQRGRVDVRLHIELSHTEQFSELDEEAVRRRIEQVRRLASELGLEDDLRASALLGLGAGFVVTEEPLAAASDADRASMRRAFDEALRQVLRMRSVEGAQTTEDLRARLHGLSELLEQVSKRRESSGGPRLARLRKRVEELLEGRKLDEERLNQELAMLADRSDVTEEIERARGHVKHLHAQLQEDGAVGRKLDFIVQELGREVNTMGSKAHELSELVVDLKSELEKLREQVQNLE